MKNNINCDVILIERSKKINSSNVDFYIAGFGADGKRVGSIICDFNPEKNPKKLKEALAEAKEKFPEAVVVEPIGADAFNQYLDGYIRGADGKPIKYVAPEPTVEAQRQIELNTLDRKYADKLSNIELEMAKAKAIEDEELYTELKEEREALMNEYSEKRGAI